MFLKNGVWKKNDHDYLKKMTKSHVP
jgi:hypothetical protein